MYQAEAHRWRALATPTVLHDVFNVHPGDVEGQSFEFTYYLISAANATRSLLSIHKKGELAPPIYLKKNNTSSIMQRKCAPEHRSMPRTPRIHPRIRAPPTRIVLCPVLRVPGSLVIALSSTRNRTFFLADDAAF